MPAKAVVERKKKMLSIIRELKQKINELEQLKGEGKGRHSVKETMTLIEEIRVPALEVLKENKKPAC